MKGGYQMLDLSDVTVGTQKTVVGSYKKLQGSRGKVILVKTPSGQSVFSEVRFQSTTALLAYLDADGSTYTVEVSNADAVDITKQPSDATTAAKVEALEDRVGAKTLGTQVDLSTYDGSTTAKIYTCPSDGYVIQNCGTSDGGVSVVDYRMADGSRLHLNAIYGSNGAQVVTFVKKGMQLVNGTATTANAVVAYRPLS